jgi:hypothetical protein
MFRIYITLQGRAMNVLTNNHNYNIPLVYTYILTCKNMKTV